MTRSETQAAYRRSEKGKAAQSLAQQRYRATNAGKAAAARYHSSTKGRIAQLKNVLASHHPLNPTYLRAEAAIAELTGALRLAATAKAAAQGDPDLMALLED